MISVSLKGYKMYRSIALLVFDKIINLKILFRKRVFFNKISLLHKGFHGYIGQTMHAFAW